MGLRIFPVQTMSAKPELTDRARHFLKVLIERYIRDGQPVGSRTLAKDADLDLSPATIRNVMADLEEMGLVTSPHTSAGRVPTVLGYRFFVDSLISIRPLDEEYIHRLRDQLGGDEAPQHLVESASRLLAGITHMAGVVMVPRQERVLIRELQFIHLSNARVLAILVTSQGEVLNRIVETSRVFSRAELEQASRFINEHYAGHDLETIKQRIVQEMTQHRRDMDRLMEEALTIADRALQVEPGEDDFVVTGQTNLMDFDELAQLDRIKELFEAFSEKQEILHLLERCSQAQGVQLFIGEESGYGPLEKCSVVTSPYTVDDQVVGVLGVIGPTRMAYDRVIPLVDVTARLLGAALKSG
ncbi:MAG TPA: heat-inducible transcriptional repressor HrcA [Thiolapillus brandeum]|uniref:Heat-inducible transcription repressor HrcA n=1 Tax=Thiolapillus brandeum TaxID=1076588 RepID=A0A7C5N7K3_9GAMM|nr:heat-inducible transcriptional repressor HrcA [Thiolapillus brandeum]